jgi:hypothetical protein
LTIPEELAHEPQFQPEARTVLAQHGQEAAALVPSLEPVEKSGRVDPARHKVEAGSSPLLKSTSVDEAAGWEDHHPDNSLHQHRQLLLDRQLLLEAPKLQHSARGIVDVGVVPHFH